MSEVLVTEKHYYAKDELYTDWYKCPRCNESDLASFFKYCPMCGVKVRFEKDTDNTLLSGGKP